MRTHFLLLFVAAVSLFSCRNGGEVDHSGNGDLVQLSVDVVSKALPTTTANIEEFAVFGARQGEKLWGDVVTTATPDLLFNATVTKSEGSWSYGTPVRWDEGQFSRHAFFGYAPIGSVDNKISLITDVATAGYPKIRYETLEDVANQVDLVVSSQINQTPVKMVAMSFVHALTRIGFTAYTNFPNIKVSSVHIRGVRYKGDLPLYRDLRWENLGADTTNFVLNTDPASVISDDEANPTYLTVSEADRFMLLPQDLSANVDEKVAVTVRYEQAGAMVEKSYTLKENWQGGKSLLYKLDLTASDLELVVDEVQITDWAAGASASTDVELVGQLGALSASVANPIAAVGAVVSVTSPKALAGMAWTAGLSNTEGFSLGAVVGAGPLATAPVTVGLNPTNAQRTSVFTATAGNGSKSTLNLIQAASTLTYNSPSANAPVGADVTSVDFTVTGTAGLTLSFAKTSGDGDFTTPADHICNGSAQTIAVNMAANNTAAVREAVYSATVTNAGASGFILTGITVKQEKGVPPTTPNPPTADQIVEIDGLSWTKGNLIAVNASNCKVGAATDHGLYFQFGSLVGWKGGSNGDGVGTTTGSLATEVHVKPTGYSGTTEWTTAGRYTGGTAGTDVLPDTDDPASGIGDPCRVYLGVPWRTPTAAEWLALVGASGANTNQGVPLKLTNYDLSFPASGNRLNSNGAFDDGGSGGYYWSSSVCDARNGYFLYFNGDYIDSQFNYDRSCGIPVRCVSGELPLPTTPNPPTADQIVEIDGLSWAKGNLIAVNASNCKVGAPTDYGLYFQFGSLVGWSGGANGDGTGTGSPALAVQVKPKGYSGSTTWPAGYYKDGTTVTKDYDLPADAPATGIGDPCRYYLGAAWRTPTAAEWLTLLGASGANTDKLLPLTVNGTALSFPDSGNRPNSSSGTLDGGGSSGIYWSSSVYSAKSGYCLTFSGGSVYPQNSYFRSNGMPVRCVS